MAAGTSRTKSRGSAGIALLVGAVVAGGLATAGWNVGERRYRSTALVEVSREIPVILYETELNGTLDESRHGQLVRLQAGLARSERVLTTALESDGLRTLLQGTGLESTEALAEVVEVDVLESFVEIAVECGDPETAQGVTTAVLDAYLDLTEARERASGLARRDELIDLRGTCAQRGNELARQIREATDQLPDVVLEQRLARHAELLVDLETEIDSARRSGDERQLSSLLDRHGETTAALRKLLATVERVRQLGAEMRLVEEQLELARRRMDALEVESRMKGRIRKATDAVLPTEPSSDNRPHLASLGAVLGLVLGSGMTLAARG